MSLYKKPQCTTVGTPVFIYQAYLDRDTQVYTSMNVLLCLLCPAKQYNQSEQLEGTRILAD